MAELLIYIGFVGCVCLALGALGVVEWVVRKF